MTELLAAADRVGTGWRPLVVEAITAVAEGVVLVTLADRAEAPPPWEPGAHVDVLLDDGYDGLVRQYSLCGSPADTGSPGDRGRLQIAVLREPAGRGGSRLVHERLAPGDRIGVRGPRNNFPLEPAPAYRFIAGGIGITPLLPMIRQVAAAGADWRLLYGGRTRASMAFLDELTGLDQPGGSGELGGSGGRVDVRPQDEQGLLPVAAFIAAAPAGTAVYCCGPEPLLGAVETACSQTPSVRLRVERFAARAVESASDQAFEVELGRSGRVLAVPAAKTLLEVLEEAGAPIVSSCREGTCGTCETAVLGGEPEHRDSLLTDEEKAAGDVIFPCVSRCRSARLVLDL